MAVVVRRGVVKVTIPNAVTAHKTKVSANMTKTLIGVILAFLNERDSIFALKADPTQKYKIKQLNGIVDKSKEDALNNASSNTAAGKFVYASDINTMITYANELVNTVGVHTQSYKMQPCSYAKKNVVIVDNPPDPVVPDQPKLDPVTGEKIYDGDGNVIMVPGFKNPIPLLDKDGNPCYYTVTKEQIFIEGQTEFPDVEQTITLCTNTGIPCTNRNLLTGWIYRDRGDVNPTIPVCTNPQRNQLSDGSVPLDASQIPSVSKDDLIESSTFNMVIANLIAVNSALESYSSWWGIDGACKVTCQVKCQAFCEGPCQATCEISCQLGCELACQDCQKTCEISCQNCQGNVCETKCQVGCEVACQSCQSGTCHNQHCGGI